MKCSTDFTPSLVNNFKPLLLIPEAINWAEIKRNGQVIIYMISDPRPDEIRCYIGQTISKNRFSQHVSDARRSRIHWPSYSEPRLSWLSEILGLGLEPKIDVLQTVNAEDANYIELLWIGLMEHSPFHILVNGLDTRSTGSSLVPLEVTIPGFNTKKRRIARIEFLQEYWLGHWSPIDEFSAEGNCLIRHEINELTSEDLIENLLAMTLEQYYLETVGPENLNNILIGMKKAYKRKDIRTSLPNLIEVRFSSYVPLRYKQNGIPPALRQE